jgi:hypothetical protein
MTDDKTCAANVNGVEDKLKCLYNLWGGGTQSQSVESKTWKEIVIKRHEVSTLTSN